MPCHQPVTIIVKSDHCQFHAIAHNTSESISTTNYDTHILSFCHPHMDWNRSIHRNPVHSTIMYYTV